MSSGCGTNPNGAGERRSGEGSVPPDIAAESQGDEPNMRRANAAPGGLSESEDATGSDHGRRCDGSVLFVSNEVNLAASGELADGESEGEKGAGAPRSAKTRIRISRGGSGELGSVR